MVTEQPQPQLFMRRVWRDGVGYTYDGINPSKCQHYPLCAEGKKEQAEHKARLKEQGVQW